MTLAALRKGILVVTLLCASVFMWPHVVRADALDEIANLNQRIQALEQQRVTYEAQAAAAGETSQTLQSEINRFNAEINQITAQINALEAKIKKTDLEVDETESSMTEAERQIGVHRGALGEFIQAYSEFDNTTITTVLLQSKQLSDFFDHLNDLERTQQQLQATILSIQQLQDELGEQRDSLRDQQESLEKLKSLQEVDQRSLASKRREKDVVLKETKGQEEQFQKLAQKSAFDIERLREQIYYLQQSGITVEDAVQAAKFAAVGAGIRPAFLLALLEVESRLGQNVGSGNWRDDMYECYIRLGTIWYPHREAHYRQRAETEKAAFMEIVNKLGLDPDSVKVSREPTYGCGGAMGPAQFIPSTWLAYEAEVARLTGHNPPSPWNTLDAFTAAAVKLARGGAASQDIAGETLAAKRYICGGNITQSICSSYSNTVNQKAAEIARSL